MTKMAPMLIYGKNLQKSNRPRYQVSVYRTIGPLGFSIPVEPASVRPSMRLFTLSNMIISTTSWPIPTKFFLKQHLGWGKAALCFGPDRIGTLVSMATDSSHRVIIGKILLAL